ncbi:MAG: tetratricopeptide repeat protein [Candidatus Limnocylindrales bacterium]
MIELMVQAEQALGLGLIDQAEKLYEQAASTDPHNAIAIVGLARVRLERDDKVGAHALVLRALAIDPENSSALRMEARLREVLAGEGRLVSPPAPPASARTSLVGRLFGRVR